MQLLAAQFQALKTSYTSNCLSEGFNLLRNTHKWFPSCKCDVEFKGILVRNCCLPDASSI